MTSKNMCEWCKKEHFCKQQKIQYLSPLCAYEPKYNVCPCCYERVLNTYERCTKCGYDFEKGYEAYRSEE